MIQDLMRVAQELGRVPTRDEYLKHGRFNKHQINAEFSSFTVAKQAAGLADEKPRKIDKTVFQRPIQDHFGEYKPEAFIPRGPYPNAAILSDTHWPFHMQRVVDLFIEYVADVKPEWVILNGDARDRYAHAKFPRSHNIFKPEEEEALSKSQNLAFWEAIKKVSPRSRCVQTLGNHDIRPLKQSLGQYPEAYTWIEKGLRESYEAPGVEIIYDHRQELFLADDLAVFHGYKTQLGSHRDFTMMNVVTGHSHLGGVSYRQIKGKVLWELNCGYAGDPAAKGLTYTGQKITNWTHGFGAIDKRGPRFIPG